MAAPRIPIDPVKVRELAAEGHSVTDIAVLVGCTRPVLYEHYFTEIKLGRTDHRINLRRQFNSATPNSTPVLLASAKRYLGIGDRSLDEHVMDAIQESGLDIEDLLEMIKLKQETFLKTPKRSFHEFCSKAGYPAPFDKQVSMMEFGIDLEEPRLLLGSRGYGKTDYITLLGVAYDMYRNPSGSTTVIITKSKDRNSAILGSIADACRKNGMDFEIENTTRLRVQGLQGKEDSVSAVPIRAKSLRGRHPHRVIMDDPVTEDDVSEATRSQARRVLNEVMKLTKNVLLIGQPAHQYDLYADVRGKVKTLELPYGTIPELDADLDAQRLAGVSEASISASYMLKVLTEGTTPFESVRYLDSFPTGESAVAFIDPSFEGGDYTALSIVKAHMQGVAVVGFVYKKAWNHCLDDMLPKLQKYNVKRLAFETNSLGEQPIELLRKLFGSIGVIGRKSNTNKHSRIMAAGAFAHLIHLSKQSDKTYLDHVVKYEYKSKFDDAPDSLASCLEWIGLIRGKT